MESDTKKRVGILRGGSGKNYEASIKKGGEVISFITDNLGNKYQVSDILVDKDHIWHFKGVPINPGDLTNKVDMVWNVSHPSFSNILESLSIPNIGSNSFTHALENSKEMLREHIKKVGGRMGRSIILPAYQASPVAGLRPREDFDGPKNLYAIKKAKEVHQKFGAPWIVRSLTPTPSMAIHVAKTFGELAQAIEDGLNQGQSMVVEEFIAGKESTVHSISNFRGEEIYVIPPSDLTKEEKEKILSSIKNLHQHLAPEHYMKSDLVLHPRLGIFIKDISFHPDLKPQSHLEESLSSIGAKLHHVVENILNGI